MSADAFEFGQSVALFTKHADAMYDKYQASGHAGTMSYDDFLEANDDGPAMPPQPQMPESPAMPSSSPPASGSQPGYFSQMGSRVGQTIGKGVDNALYYSPPAMAYRSAVGAGNAIGAGVNKLTAGAKQLYQWGTTPVGQLYPNTFGPKQPAPPKPPNPQWEAQRQNFEGSMF